MVDVVAQFYTVFGEIGSADETPAMTELRDRVEKMRRRAVDP